MTDKQIRNKYKSISKRIAAVQEDLTTLQAICPHTNHERVAKSDIGNWYRGDDIYWFACNCAACGKRWTVRQ